MRTPLEVKEEFSRRGISISEWARSQGFSTHLVYQVLSGKKKAIRGQSHQIAVALELKEGLVSELKDFPFSRLGSEQSKEVSGE